MGPRDSPTQEAASELGLPGGETGRQTWPAGGGAGGRVIPGGRNSIKTQGRFGPVTECPTGKGRQPREATQGLAGCGPGRGRVTGHTDDLDVDKHEAAQGESR